MVTACWKVGRLTHGIFGWVIAPTALNPIRAKVSLGLRVLNYQYLGLYSPGGAVFLAHQIAKEAMALLSLRP